MGCNKKTALATGITLLLFGASSHATDLTAEQDLGKNLYEDESLSLNNNQSCASCHSLNEVKLFGGTKTSTPGFVDPENVATGSPTSGGSVDGLFGGLNSPSAGYAAFSPDLHFDANEGLWIGGQFWNGRAATLEEQAKGPFLNPVEMAMPSRWAVVTKLKENREYVRNFRNIYGVNLDSIPAYPMAPADAEAPPEVDEAYDLLAQAIAQFERSRELNRFTSKFDFVEAGLAEYTPQEQEGLELFDDKAQCSACHVMDRAEGPDGLLYPPVFTDFTYDNIGVPRNHSIPGDPQADIGLSATTGNSGDDGKHKVMSLRNIELTAPYSHNGYFRTLEQIVHFYNTRDVAAEGWAPPEVPQNVNVNELGNLGLTAEEEAAIVAFMKTLTDGYGKKSPW